MENQRLRFAACWKEVLNCLRESVMDATNLSQQYTLMVKTDFVWNVMLSAQGSAIGLIEKRRKICMDPFVQVHASFVMHQHNTAYFEN